MIESYRVNDWSKCPCGCDNGNDQHIDGVTWNNDHCGKGNCIYYFNKDKCSGCEHYPKETEVKS